MEVVMTSGAISWAKSNHHHQQTNTQFFTGRMPFLSPNQQCQSTEGKILQLNIEKLSATKHQMALETVMSTPPSFQPALSHFTLP